MNCVGVPGFASRRLQRQVDELGIGVDADDRLVLLRPLLAEEHFERPLAQANLAGQPHPNDFLLPLRPESSA